MVLHYRTPYRSYLSKGPYPDQASECHISMRLILRLMRSPRCSWMTVRPLSSLRLWHFQFSTVLVATSFNFPAIHSFLSPAATATACCLSALLRRAQIARRLQD